MNTKEVKNYYESEAEDDHLSDSDYTEENSSIESEGEYEQEQDQMDNEPVENEPFPRTRRSVGRKPDTHTIEITAIKNSITKEMREKKEKKKTETKKMSKVRGYKRARMSDGMDWTSSMDPDRIRTRSERKRFQEERNIHEDMLTKLEADGHLLRYNDDELLILCK